MAVFRGSQGRAGRIYSPLFPCRSRWRFIIEPWSTVFAGDVPVTVHYPWAGESVKPRPRYQLDWFGFLSAYARVTKRFNAAMQAERDAQRIEAGTDETAQQAQPEGQEPDGEADAPEDYINRYKG
jgi:hypothetical protein